MNQQPKNRGLLILLHLVFFLSGIVTVLIGQVLPTLAGGFALNDFQAGFFFPSQFAGSITGTLLTTWFGRRDNFVLASVLGCLAMAVGVTAMALNFFEGSLAGFFITGLGVGMTLPSVNMLVLEMNPLRGASALSILNFCWGVGAIVSKPFVDATSTTGSIFVTSLFLAVPLLIGATLMLVLPRGGENRPLSIDPEKPDPAAAAIWVTPLAWTIALFNFIHVGFESGMHGWLTTYADRVHGEPVVQVFSPTFLYFVFFVVGRGLAPALFRYFTVNRVLFLDIGLMLAGTLIILSAGNLAWLMVGASVSGLGTSSVFPTNLSRFTGIFGPTATRRGTPLFICGTLGAITVTWLIGFVSTQAESLRAGMFALLVSVVVLGVIQTILSSKSATPNERRSGA